MIDLIGLTAAIFAAILWVLVIGVILLDEDLAGWVGPVLLLSSAMAVAWWWITP